MQKGKTQDTIFICLCDFCILYLMLTGWSRSFSSRIRPVHMLADGSADAGGSAGLYIRCDRDLHDTLHESRSEIEHQRGELWANVHGAEE